jgi:hypothetical protein
MKFFRSGRYSWPVHLTQKDGRAYFWVDDLVIDCRMGAYSERDSIAE